MKPARFIIVISPDFRVVPTTVAAAVEALMLEGFQPVLVMSTTSGLLNARNESFAVARRMTKGDEARGFMIDDDIHYADTVDNLRKAIHQSEIEKSAFVAPYLLGSGKSSIHDGTNLLTWKEAMALKNWSEIDTGGLGFYYGPLPLNYHFHVTDSAKGLTGEDILFFRENHIKPHVLQVKLQHLKLIPIPQGIDDEPIGWGCRDEKGSNN